MKGLQLEISGQSMPIAVPKGTVTVIVGCNNGKYFVNASGMDAVSTQSKRWMDDDDVIEGTEIKVLCCDVSEPAVPVSSVESGSDTIELKLEKYKYALHLIDKLRPELVKAGLVGTEE